MSYIVTIKQGNMLTRMCLGYEKNILKIIDHCIHRGWGVSVEKTIPIQQDYFQQSF